MKKLRNIFDKTLNRAIDVGQYTAKYVEVTDSTIFEEIDNIFDDQKDGLMWLEDKFGPVFFLQDKIGLHFYNDGEWFFKIEQEGNSLRMPSPRYIKARTARAKRGQIIRDQTVVKLSMHDMEHEKSLFVKLTGYRVDVLLIPLAYRDEWHNGPVESHIGMMRRAIMHSASPDLIISYH